MVIMNQEDFLRKQLEFIAVYRVCLMVEKRRFVEDNEAARIWVDEGLAAEFREYYLMEQEGLLDSSPPSRDNISRIRGLITFITDYKMRRESAPITVPLDFYRSDYY
jgi:hypothetical protein